MAEAQRRMKRSSGISPRRRIEYIASVRFGDGRCQLFSVSNADDSQQARQMVFDELQDVAAVVVAERR